MKGSAYLRDLHIGQMGRRSRFLLRQNKVSLVRVSNGAPYFWIWRFAKKLSNSRRMPSSVITPSSKLLGMRLTSRSSALSSTPYRGCFSKRLLKETCGAFCRTIYLEPLRCKKGGGHKTPLLIEKGLKHMWKKDNHPKNWAIVFDHQLSL